MTFDMDTLGDDLHDLLVRSCELASRHRSIAFARGVNFIWSDAVFDPGQFPMLQPYVEDVVAWGYRDGDGDMLTMTVPLDVLKGERSVEQWADDTVNAYFKEQGARLERQRLAREEFDRKMLKSLIDKYGVPDS